MTKIVFTPLNPVKKCNGLVSTTGLHRSKDMRLRV